MDRKTVVKNVLLVLVFVAIAGCVFGLIHYLDHRGTEKKTGYETAEPDPVCLYLGDLEYEIKDNIKTYLIVGTDGAGSKPNASHYHGPMSDYLLLLVINKTKNTHGFVQIDRDTMTDIVRIGEDGDEESADIVEEQICVSTWFGKDLDQGLTNLTDSVYNVLGGLPIDGYYSINMDDIDKLNHAVGGVTVKVEDDLSAKDEALKPGATVHLTDEQAVIFVRSRMDVGDGTNESRMRRQRTYMDALIKQAKDKMASDKSFVTDVYGAMNEVATTNIPGNRVSAVANLVYKTEPLGIKDIGGKHTEGRVGDERKDYMHFYADEDSILEILTELCGLDEGHEY